MNFTNNNTITLECNDVYNLYVNRCEFVRIKCNDYDGILINTIELIYCHFNDHPILWGCPILLAMLLILFILIGLVADDFLCPSLLTISKMLHLSDNIAGVTLLAFGNGAPDVFTSLGGIVNQSKPHLIFSSLFGAGTFVTTIIVGVIILNGGGDGFQMNKRPLMRDILFYIIAAFLTWTFIYYRVIHISNAIGLISLYLIYILIIFIGRFIYLKTEKNKKLINNNNNKLNGIDKSNNSLHKIDELELDNNDEMIKSRFIRNSLQHSRRSRTMSNVSCSGGKHIVHHHWCNTIHSVSKCIEMNDDVVQLDKININININNDNNQENLNKKTYLSQFSMIEMMSETKNFIIHICPIDLIEWTDYSLWKKTLQLLKSIPYFILIICIPVVDLESMNDNWCRLLCCINILIAPQIVLYFEKINVEIGGHFPLWALLLIISIILIIVIMLTSTKDSPPIYHRLFAVIGFLVSIIFIQNIANEIISILQTFGIIFHLSDDFIGLTILAWGNSVGDLLSNLSMAKHGYHTMAIAASFGGPIFNILIGLGVPYLLLFIKNSDNSVNIDYTELITLPYAALTISLCTSLLMFIGKNFHSYRLHGYLLIIIYVIYLIIAVLIEFHII